MKVFFVLLGLLVLLFGATTTQAKVHANLMPNGSFEKGVNNWELQGATIVSGGRCGVHAANLSNGFARQIGYKLKAGVTYKLVFWYKGTLISSLQPDILTSPEWEKRVYEFTAEEQQPTVWFLGFENKPLLVDCIKLVIQ